jgi:hypothetical protein
LVWSAHPVATTAAATAATTAATTAAMPTSEEQSNHLGHFTIRVFVNCF